MDMVEKARVFATAAHAAVGQKRKYTGEDYIHHPIHVCTILKEAGYTCEHMLSAALCHDLIEDTEVSLKIIEDEFGTEVASLVNGLTDVSKPKDGNRAKRKELDRKHTAKQSGKCKTIKLADLISNSSSILQHDREFAKVYLKEKLLLLDSLTEGDRGLWHQALDIATVGLRELGELQ